MSRRRKSHVPRAGSRGPAGTFAHVESAALARFLEDVVRGREMACITSLLRGFFCGEWWCRRESRLYPFYSLSPLSGAVVRRRTCQEDGGSLFRRVSPGLVVCKRRKVVFFWFGTRSISVFRLLELRLLGRESTANNRIHSPPFPFFRSHFPGTFTSGV